MNIHFNSYCIKKSCISLIPSMYVEVSNFIPGLVIYFILQYTFRGNTITVSSDIIGFNQKKIRLIHGTSVNAWINIIKITAQGEDVLFNVPIILPSNRCFKVVGTLEQPRCELIPC